MRAIVQETLVQLEGVVPINGSKNAALPIMAACLLTSESVLLHNVPNILDVVTMVELLRSMGAQVSFKLNPSHANHTMIINCERIDDRNPSPKLAGKIRASFLLLGPLLSRFGYVRMPLPGGSDIGVRGIDLHVEALESLGASIDSIDGNYDSVEARVDGRLRGNDITLNNVSVGATENVLMAAVLARGMTVIRNAACEPDVTDLANFLVKLGARIQGIGTRKLTVFGVSTLQGCEHTIIPDRHEAATYALAAIMTGGRLELLGIRKHHLSAVVKELQGFGGKITDNPLKGSITVKRRKGRRLKPLSICTDPYPGFPTDMQPIFCAALTLATPSKRKRSSTTSVLYEKVFEQRVGHTAELLKLRADICTVNVNNEHQIVIRGSPQGLFGSTVVANDIRSGAGLILAGLVAHGETVIENAEHVLRGYEALDLKLNSCGACVLFLN